MDGGIIGQNKLHDLSQDRQIELVDGNLFDPLAPAEDWMTLEVIGTALANSTRFGGQIRRFYSIAQHSVLVALLSDKDMAAQRCALLHDADECFGLPDLATPVKPCFPDYVAAQKRIGAAVDSRYGISPEDHRRTKPADREALLIEKHALKDRRNAAYWKRWSVGVVMPDWVRITPLQPDEAMVLIEDAIERVFEMELPVTAEWLYGRNGFIISHPDLQDTPQPAL